jgi:fatty-acyl-CoA synthase
MSSRLLLNRLVAGMQLKAANKYYTSQLKLSSNSSLGKGVMLPNKLSYRHTDVGDLRLIGSTMYQRLEETVVVKPNSEAFKFCPTGESYTFKELKQRVDEVAQNLLKHGYKRGDRLAIMLPNTSEFVLIALAAGSIGVTSVLLNPGYQLVEIEYMLKKTKSRGVVILDNLKSLQHYKVLTQICPELSSSNGELSSAKLPDLKHVFLVHNVLVKNEPHAFKGTLPFSTLTKNNTTSVERPYVDMNDDFAMLFTVTELILKV